jgi:hypothetical protein
MLYALRDAGEGDELVTDENLRKKIRDKAALKYVLNPTHVIRLLINPLN